MNLKDLRKEKTIPTLLALILLIVAFGLGIAIFVYRQQVLAQSRELFYPKNIKIINQTSTSFSITWQTDNPISGKISYGTSIILNNQENDVRDSKEQRARMTHFVTLKDLKAQTKYYFKINDGLTSYPDQPLEVTTLKEFDQLKNNIYSPIRGTVLSNKFAPIDEALIFLQLNNAADIGTYTSTAGNFILSLKDLMNKNLTEALTLSQKTPAKLIIKRGTLQSEVIINLPLDNISLPPILLGQNFDFSNLQATPSGTATQSAQRRPVNKYDLNSDGKVNSVDLSILLDEIIKKPVNKKSDFNLDNITDSKDIDELKRVIQ